MEKKEDNPECKLVRTDRIESYREFIMRSKKVEVVDFVPGETVRSFVNCDNFMDLRQVLREPFVSHMMKRKGLVLAKCDQLCGEVKAACINAIRFG